MVSRFECFGYALLLRRDQAVHIRDYIHVTNLAQAHILALGNGYDHNFVLHTAPVSPLSPAARVTAGGLCLECLTTQPGLQLYTANYLDGTPGKGGASYGPHSAFCLEPQDWPDAIHHGNFPSPVLRAGEILPPYHRLPGECMPVAMMQACGPNRKRRIAS